jgi:glutathione S-transferase
MSELAQNHAFQLYAATALLLTGNILYLWVKSGFVRAGTHTVRNAEDIQNVKGAEHLEQDPPAVARVLRAHRNAVDNIVPFLIAGLLYVLLGAGLTGALAFFAPFVLVRLIHSFAYLGAKQPLRTISFVVGLLITIGLIGYDGFLIVHHAIA